MKGATLLAKTEKLFEPLAGHLQSLGYSYVGGNEGSIVLDPDREYRFTLYDRPAKPSVFEECEIPEKALRMGYRFGYMVECRSEALFCDVLIRTPPETDIMICDSDGNLFRPNELSPASIRL